MIELLPEMKKYFDMMQDRFTCFYDLGFQSEGWFKGELLTLFCQLQHEGRIEELDREIKIGIGTVDIRLRVGNEYHWIELKHWLVGNQKGVRYKPNFYFSDPTSVGITKDIDKLNTLTGYHWMLILLTANPGIDEWLSGVEKFNRKFTPRQLESRTQPDMFPPAYFLGLLDCSLVESH